MEPSHIPFYIPGDALDISRSGHQTSTSHVDLNTAPLQHRSDIRRPAGVFTLEPAQNTFHFLILRLQDVPLRHHYCRSGRHSSREPCRGTTAGQRSSRGEMQQQCLQLPADLLQFRTYVYPVILHFFLVHIDVDQGCDLD